MKTKDDRMTRAKLARNAVPTEFLSDGTRRSMFFTKTGHHNAYSLGCGYVQSRNGVDLTCKNGVYFVSYWEYRAVYPESKCVHLGFRLLKDARSAYAKAIKSMTYADGLEQNGYWRLWVKKVTV